MECTGAAVAEPLLWHRTALCFLQLAGAEEDTTGSPYMQGVTPQSPQMMDSQPSLATLAVQLDMGVSLDFQLVAMVVQVFTVTTPRHCLLGVVRPQLTEALEVDISGAHPILRLGTPTPHIGLNRAASEVVASLEAAADFLAAVGLGIRSPHVFTWVVAAVMRRKVCQIFSKATT